jgi:NAD(P)-dependent dehydrogenase (short-subunit alcohol dehydrogenase family)
MSIMAAADLFSLSGCTALVTGARRGVNNLFIVGLAPHGAKVVCAAHTKDDLAAFTGIVRSVAVAATLRCIDRGGSGCLTTGANRLVFPSDDGRKFVFFVSSL